jgi:hypothetical protein
MHRESDALDYISIQLTSSPHVTISRFFFVFDYCLASDFMYSIISRPSSRNSTDFDGKR